VIHALLSCDGDAHLRVRQATRKLSSLATVAAATLEAGDIDGWADVLTRSTVAQAELHPRLVGPAGQSHQRSWARTPRAMRPSWTWLVPSTMVSCLASR
jgi:hypothetical protein